MAEPTEQDATLALYAQLLQEARELARRIADCLRSLHLDPGAVPDGVAPHPDAPPAAPGRGDAARLRRGPGAPPAGPPS